jgi:hypothetical protein
MEKYAVLSKASYDFYNEGADAVKKELEHYEMSNYKLNEKLSKKKIGIVLESPEEVVVSYRGTDVRNPSDLFADVGIVLGRHRANTSIIQDRFTQADDFYKDVKKEFPDKKITLTGHSLGNTESLYVGRKNAVQSVGFNGGASYNDVVVGLMCKMFGKCNEADKLHTIYTTGKDPLSIGNILGNENIVKITPKKRKDFLYHSLEYFMPERPLGLDRPAYFLPVRTNKRQKYLDLDTINEFKFLGRPRAELR